MGTTIFKYPQNIQKNLCINEKATEKKMPTLPLSSLNCQTSTPFITTDVFLYHQDRSPSFQTTLWNCLPLCPEHIQSLSACTITSPGTRLLGACGSGTNVPLRVLVFQNCWCT